MPQSRSLHTLAQERFGYDRLHPGQERAVKSVLAGHDTLVVMPTGGGKSAIYQLAASMISGATVVVSPLLALQRDQVQAIAQQDLGEAVVINSTVGDSDRRGEGIALGSLGIAYDSLGQYERAINYHQQYLTIVREIGDRHGEGYGLGNLGNAYYSLGQYERAISLYQQQLTITREVGDRWGEGIGFENLGGSLIKLERYSEALELLQKALKIDQEISFRSGEAATLKKFAHLHQALGEVEVARQYCQQALELATELGIPLTEECQKLMKELEERGASEGK
mgnify:CR=1 FL=1